MLTQEARLLGAKRRAVLQREEALSRYYESPNFCRECNEIIHPVGNQKIREVKQKVFCNSSCSATFHNATRKKIEIEKPRSERKKSIPFNFLIEKTKKEIFDSHKNWQSARTSIRRHAAYICSQNEKGSSCSKCGYDKHYEIAHIKAVSDFGDNAKIEEINSPDNLILLCPNCHWEFDNTSG